MINNEKYNYKKLVNDITGCLQLKPLINANIDIIRKLKNKMQKNKINNLLNGNLQVEFLDLRELYLITDVIYQMFQDGKFLRKLNEEQQQLSLDLDPKNYFDEEEIKQYENILPLPEEEDNFETIIIENALYLKEGVFQTTIDFNQVLDLRERGILIYNKDAQRETEKYQWRGMYLEKAKVFSKSVEEMTVAMKEDSYIPTTLTINVPITENGDEQFYVKKDPVTGINKIIIKIDKNTLLNLIDGNHRVLAGIQARRLCEAEGEKFIRRMGLQIMHVDPYTSRHFIFQESKKNPLDETLVASLEQNIENEIAYDMNKGNKNKNPLSGLLGREEKDVIYLNKLTTLAKFAEGLKEFKIDPKDVLMHSQIKIYLKEFFRYILSYHKDEMRNISKSRNLSFKLNSNMFIGYVFIASKLFKKDNWKEDIIEILNKIDYSNDKDSILSNFHLNKSEMNKTNTKKFFDYLNKIIDDVRGGSNEENKGVL